MNKKEPINKSSLIISIITLILGIILCFNDSGNIFTLIGYFVSGLLIVSGIIKLIMAMVANKKRQDSDYGSIFISILLIALGGSIAIFPKSIMITFSLCVGAIVIFIGIQRLVLGIAVNKIDRNGSVFYIIESILIILLGIIILTQRFINLLGAFLIIYAISELVGYIYYTSQNKDYSEVLNKKVTKEMKESEAKDAIIDED